MKKKYEVIWSNVAEKDLIDIVEYISADSPSTALKIFKGIKQKASIKGSNLLLALFFSK